MVHHAEALLEPGSWGASAEAVRESGSRDGVVVRALAFRQCVPGLIPGVICLDPVSYVG